MMISTKGRYAIRIMTDVAQNDSEMPVNLRGIAMRQEISEKYLEQIIQALVKTGLLTSVRGSQGGYHLAVRPEEITIGRILRATEGDLAPVECISDLPKRCNRSGKCPAQRIYRKIYSAINEVVDHLTLEDVLKDADELRDK